MGKQTEYTVWLTKEIEVSFVVTATDEDEATEKALDLANEKVWINVAGSPDLNLVDETDSDWEASHTEEA